MSPSPTTRSFWPSTCPRAITMLAAWATLAGTSLANGAVSAALAAIAALPLGYFFGITTLIQLLELAHPSQPLFRRLLLEAPGTYHHSVIVASLAERGASAIGADTLDGPGRVLLSRRGQDRSALLLHREPGGGRQRPRRAWTRQPAPGPFSATSPTASRWRSRYRLPSEVVDVIQQHHGTPPGQLLLRTRQPRTARARGEELSEEALPLPGPQATDHGGGAGDAGRRGGGHCPLQPSTLLRGTGARGSRDRRTNGLLDQLDESGLTLKELEAIRRAFVSVLQGVYHPRLQYPVFPSPAPARAVQARTEVAAARPWTGREFDGAAAREHAGQTRAANAVNVRAIQGAAWATQLGVPPGGGDHGSGNPPGRCRAAAQDPSLRQRHLAGGAGGRRHRPALPGLQSPGPLAAQRHRDGASRSSSAGGESTKPA